jgi:signal transduction histidine kinase
VALIVLLGATALGWATTGQVLAPLRDLTYTTRHISEVDLSARLGVEGQDEIAELAETLNDLFARLEAAIPIQLQFLDDLGQELEGPIGTIRDHLDRLPDDPDERRRSLQTCQDELDRMSRDLHDVVTLAESVRPDFLVTREVDLTDLTIELRTRARTLAPGRLWSVESTGQAMLTCDPDRVTEAMSNLIINASQQTKPGDRIGIGSSIADGMARIWVTDTGPGIDDDEMARMFERFGQARDVDSDRRASVGLLLPVVAAIAEAHGGHTEIESDHAAGTTITLVLPYASAAPADG